MFEQRNIVLNAKRIAEGEDYEAVFSLELVCSECGCKVSDEKLDRWLIIGFPLVFECPRCREHSVINFDELDLQVDELTQPIPVAEFPYNAVSLS